MSKPSIYTVGGTVQAGGGIYIKRQADEELHSLCRDRKFAYVLTSRQMGKSSLMVRTAQRLIEEEIQSVVIDLTQVGTQVTAEQWYLGLLTIIEGTLVLDTDVVQWWQQHSHLGFTQRLTLFFQKVLLAEVSSPIVIFVDEIDTTLSLDFTDDFFAAIRYFYVARAQVAEFHRLSFVLIGVATPGDLIRDPKRTPFNIGQRLNLTDFTFEETNPLAEGLGLPTNKALQVLQWVMEWTGGHPYLTQQLCSIISQQNNKNWSKADVGRVVNSTFFDTMSQQDSNLQFVRDMLTKRAPDVFDVLTAYREIYRGRHPVLDEEQSLVKSHLKLSGVVRCHNKVLHIRNLIYRQVFDDKWVKEHLPVRITKEQLRLTLIGGLSIGSVVALILAAVAGWQWQKARINEIQATTKSSQALFASDKRLDALVEALRAKEKLRTLGTKTTEIKNQVDLALRQAIYGANEYNRLSGHGAKVHLVTFSPNGQLVATASADMTVKLWQRDGSLLHTLTGHKGAVYGVTFSPDGQTIASTSDDRTVKLWKLDGTLLKTFNHTNTSEVYAVAFSPDGQTLASATWDGKILLQKRDGTLLSTILGHQESVDAVAFSPDGKTIASGSWDKTVKLWKLDGSLLTTLQHNDKVLAIAQSPDGQFLATASADKTVKLWKNNGKSGFETRPYQILKGHDGQVHGVAFSPDSRLIASVGWDKTVRLWQREGTEIAVLKGHSGVIWGVAFSPNGQTIATASDDKTVRFWHWKHPLLTALNGHSATVHGVKFSPDGQFIATASEDNTVKLWRSNGNPVMTFTGHSNAVWDIAFHPNGETIATASWDKTVKLWQRDGSLIKSLVGHRSYVNAVAFSPDGQMLASASDDKTVKLWQPNGSPITTLNGHTDEVWAVTFSPDSQTIVSASQDNTIKFWKRDGTLVRTVNVGSPVTSVTFSPNGQLVATGSWDKTVKLWKPDGTLVTTLTGHNAEVFGVAFSPDGNIIASASGDQTVKLWRTTDGTLLTTFQGHNATVWKVAFSPDGETIVSGDEDKRVLLWNWKRFRQQDELQVYSCEWLRDYLRTQADVQSKDNRLCS